MSFPIRPDVPHNRNMAPGRVPSAETPDLSPPLQRADAKGYFPLLNPDASWSSFAMLDLLASKMGQADGKGAIRVRWPIAAMPLTLYVKDAPPAFAERVMAQAALWEAASIPCQSLQPLVRFQRLFALEPDQQPDIVIAFETETVLGRDNETGHTDRTVDAKGLIRQVRITLIEQPAVYARLSPAEQAACLDATVLHELGHALGLEHSEHKADAMYYRGWKNTVLTQGDVAALQALYVRPDALLG